MDLNVLQRFVEESNMIEGIYETKLSDIKAHAQFLAQEPTVSTISQLVYSVAGASLRRHQSMNVRVGNHIAPPGGPEIEPALKAILDDAENVHPVITHERYLKLHPFMDGNGRSARALWLHRMQTGKELNRTAALGFLHSYYYQTLDLADHRTFFVSREVSKFDHAG